MDEKELYSILGYVTISKYRRDILKALGDDAKIPSQIAKKLNIKTTQVSGGLADLKKKNLVVCKDIPRRPAKNTAASSKSPKIKRKGKQ